MIIHIVLEMVEKTIIYLLDQRPGLHLGHAAADGHRQPLLQRTLGVCPWGRLQHTRGGAWLKLKFRGFKGPLKCRRRCVLVLLPVTSCYMLYPCPAVPQFCWCGLRRCLRIVFCRFCRPSQQQWPAMCRETFRFNTWKHGIGIKESAEMYKKKNTPNVSL